ncbi:hypothetical protein VTL71DRAFT_3851 [Oculimacula yallundae]
MSLKY